MTIIAKPVVLRSWSVISDLDQHGQACFTFTIGNPGVGDHKLMVFVDPRAVQIERVLMFDSTGDAVPIDAKSLPYMIRDLTESVTRDQFRETARRL